MSRAGWRAFRGRQWLEGNSFATLTRLYDRLDNVGAQAMSTATEHVDRRNVKPASNEVATDLYDPYFPTRRRIKEVPDLSLIHI